MADKAQSAQRLHTPKLSRITIRECNTKYAKTERLRSIATNGTREIRGLCTLRQLNSLKKMSRNVSTTTSHLTLPRAVFVVLNFALKVSVDNNG